jgi:transposase-like protein
MASYTQLERKKILESRNSDESIKQFSNRIGVSTTSLYQWLKDFENESSKSFAPLQVTNLPNDSNEKISIIYEKFIIQLPVQTDVVYIRSIIGC